MHRLLTRAGAVVAATAATLALSAVSADAATKTFYDGNNPGIQTDTPFVPALDAFHDSTRPRTWLEGLVKAYVGDGLASDFYREIAAHLPDPDRALILDVLADTGHADFAVREVRAAIATNRTLSGRLALWGRRLVGEAMRQAQAVIAERDQLAALILEGTGDLAGVGRLVERITSAHTERMRTLGLNP